MTEPKKDDLGFDPDNLPQSQGVDLSHLKVSDVRDRFVAISDGEIQGIVDDLGRARQQARDHREYVARIIKILADATELGLRIIA